MEVRNKKKGTRRNKGEDSLSGIRKTSWGNVKNEDHLVDRLRGKGRGSRSKGGGKNGGDLNIIKRHSLNDDRCGSKDVGEQKGKKGN